MDLKQAHEGPQAAGFVGLTFYSKRATLAVNPWM